MVDLEGCAFILGGLSVVTCGSVLYIGAKCQDIGESIRMTRDRYFGSPSMKESIVQRENMESRLHDATESFQRTLKRDCLKEMKANSVLEHLEKNYGKINFDIIKREERESIEAKYAVPPAIAHSLYNLMNTALCSTPECLLLEGARLGEEQASALAKEHEQREWVARYGEGLTKDEIARAERDLAYRWEVVCSKHRQWARSY